MSLRGARVEVHAEHYDKLRRLFALAAAAAGVTSTVGRRRLTVSKSMLKPPIVSALETITS
jgi:hypothetical protein